MRKSAIHHSHKSKVPFDLAWGTLISHLSVWMRVVAKDR